MDPGQNRPRHRAGPDAGHDHSGTDVLTPRDPRDRLIVALDVPSLEEAAGLAGRLEGAVRWFKIGPQLYLASGPAAVAALSPRGRVFLDLKFHDIPATVAAGVSGAARLGVDLLTVHAWGGRSMLEAARKAAETKTAASATSTPPRSGPRVVAVTVLTSGEADTLREIGVDESPETSSLRLARLARAAGLAGVVASPLDASAIRAACGDGFLIVSPGIRPLGAGGDDQRRWATPRDAIVAGADMLVVGRPITRAPDPRAAAEAILGEIASAM